MKLIFRMAGGFLFVFGLGTIFLRSPAEAATEIVTGMLLLGISMVLQK